MSIEKSRQQRAWRIGFATAPIAFASALIAACVPTDPVGGGDSRVSEVDAAAEADGLVGELAVARIEPTVGHTATGTARFVLEDDGTLSVRARLAGLEPGPHGIHIHENGDCSAPDAASAGDHFAPDSSPHGAPEYANSARHAGDLGNLVADKNGVADFELSDEVLTLEGIHGVIERAIVVHRDADDLESQPAGDSGPPVACGVIRMAGTNGGRPESGAPAL